MTRSFEFERREISRADRITLLYGQLKLTVKKQGKTTHLSKGVDIMRLTAGLFTINPIRDFEGDILSYESTTGMITITTYPYACTGAHDESFPPDIAIRVRIGTESALRIRERSARLISGAGKDLGEAGDSDLFYFAGMVSMAVTPKDRMYTPPNS
mgnify:CR=1 FL=1